MLMTLFQRQKIFQKRVVGVDLPKLIPNQIPITTTSIVAELGEILELVQHWKTWRKNPPSFKREDLGEELADLWHFVINLSLYLGFDADEVYAFFIAKNDKNHKRQDDGY
jgi:NTP pyrophosphatase (non-canonical NTP hydrolase)